MQQQFYGILKILEYPKFKISPKYKLFAIRSTPV